MHNEAGLRQFCPLQIRIGLKYRCIFAGCLPCSTKVFHSLTFPKQIYVNVICNVKWCWMTVVCPFPSLCIHFILYNILPSYIFFGPQYRTMKKSKQKLTWLKIYILKFLFKVSKRVPIYQ